MDLFVGIDVSKNKHDIAIINEQKNFVGQPFVIDDDRQGYQFLLKRLEYLTQRFGVDKFYIGLESTADYWKNLYYYLKQQSDGFLVSVLNPILTHAHAKTELRRAKTDAVNAKDIARFMVEKRPTPSFDRHLVFDIIKDIDKQMYQLTKQQTMSVNKLRLELTKVAPEIEKKVLNVQSKQILALLSQFSTAEIIANATVEQLSEVRYGKKNWKLPLSFIENIKKLAENSVAYKTGVGADYVVQSLARTICQFQQEIEWLKSQLNELFLSVFQQSVLETIPGIARETAIVLEAYIGGVHRFANVKRFVAYFGMNPTVNTSGKYSGASYLQKKGLSIVRHKLFMATLSMIRTKQEPIISFYNRLIDAGKPKLVAVIACMRKLLVIIYYMLKKQESFTHNK